MGILQQAVPVALLLVAGGLRQNAGHHAAYRVRHRHGRDLPAGEDKVPQADLLVHALVDKPLVNALIVAADQGQVVVIPQELPGLLLVEGGAAGERKMVRLREVPYCSWMYCQQRYRGSACITAPRPPP